MSSLVASSVGFLDHVTLQASFILFLSHATLKQPECIISTHGKYQYIIAINESNLGQVPSRRCMADVDAVAVAVAVAVGLTPKRNNKILYNGFRDR
jgi:hypothetical protein